MAGTGGKAAAAPRDPNLWLVLGAFGVLLFFVGVFKPALASRTYADAFRYGFAIAGGALAVFGFTRWSEVRTAARRREEKRRDARGIPESLQPMRSLEVYDPRATTTTPTSPPREAEEPAVRPP